MANDDPFLTALDARLEATKPVYTLEQFAEALHHLIVAALYDPKAKDLLLEIARVGEGNPEALVTEWLEAQRQRIRIQCSKPGPPKMPGRPYPPSSSSPHRAQGADRNAADARRACE